MSKGEKKKTSAGVRPNQQKGNDNGGNKGGVTKGEKSGRDAREDRSVDKMPKRKAS